MAVDLNDLIDSLKREVNPPGVNLYPDAGYTDWSGHLRDAFWQARLFGTLTDWEENAAARGGPSAFSEGIVTPNDAEEDYDTDDDMMPDLQQLVVLYAGYRVTLSSLQNVKATFRAKAGPVEYETQKSASLLKSVLDAIKQKIDAALSNLSDYGTVDVEVLDGMIQRTYAMENDETWFVNS